MVESGMGGREGKAPSLDECQTERIRLPVGGEPPQHPGPAMDSRRVAG